MDIFEHVIVIGYGVITGAVLSVVDGHSKQYNYSLEYIEYEVHPFNTAKKFAEANSVDYQVIEDKHALTDYFIQSAMTFKLLIISASNNYLVPKNLVEKRSLIFITRYYRTYQEEMHLVGLYLRREKNRNNVAVCDGGHRRRQYYYTETL